MIRPRSLHGIEQVADYFLARDAAPPAPPAPRPPDPPRVATVAATESAVRLAQQLARAAGDWSALGLLQDAVELSAPARPCRCPLDALLCLVTAGTELPPRLPAHLAHFLTVCRARRVIVLLVLPARTDGPEARRRAEAALETLQAALGRPPAVLCVREEDLRGDPQRTRAILGAVRVAVGRGCGTAARTAAPWLEGDRHR